MLPTTTSVRSTKSTVSLEQRLRWATQVAEAIEFIHGAGVIHGDLTCANIFLDGNLDAKLADFAGSSIDGCPLLIAVTASHEYPGELLSVQGDLFAFGSVLYEIMTGGVPYDGRSDNEIGALYLKGEFPDTRSPPQSIGEVIGKCWKGEYGRCEAVVNDLRGISFHLSISVCNDLIIDMKQQNNHGQRLFH